MSSNLIWLLLSGPTRCHAEGPFVGEEKLFRSTIVTDGRLLVKQPLDLLDGGDPGMVGVEVCIPLRLLNGLVAQQVGHDDQGLAGHDQA